MQATTIEQHHHHEMPTSGGALTSLPLLRAGLPLASVRSIALAADTLSIATMEIVDNATMPGVPGAAEDGVGSILFWGSLSFAQFKHQGRVRTPPSHRR